MSPVLQRLLDGRPHLVTLHAVLDLRGVRDVREVVDGGDHSRAGQVILGVLGVVELLVGDAFEVW